MNTTNGKWLCLSGGFDPLHVGHIAMMRAAKDHSETVGIALNSDDWLNRKKGYVVMPWAQRAEILLSLKYVDFVIPVDDSDDTVCQALRQHQPTYFGNGGDRISTNTPELKLCHELGIVPLFNLGGAKSGSSSELIQSAREQRLKSWGSYKVLYAEPGYKVKILILSPGKHISYQRHFKRKEHWYVVSGEAMAVRAEQTHFLREGGMLDIPVGYWHQLRNQSSENPLIVHEVQLGEDCDELDIERAELPSTLFAPRGFL